MDGVVVEFDEHVGLGIVESAAGVRYPFHCTQIADGSRTIESQTRVTFDVCERHKGPEAYEVNKV